MHSLTMIEPSCPYSQKANHSFITHGEHDDLNEKNKKKQSSIEIIDNVLNEKTNFCLGHLNINSIPNKLSSIMEIIKGKLDIFLISETKIDKSFPISQFSVEGFRKPFRRERKIGAGGLLLYPFRDHKDIFVHFGYF